MGIQSASVYAENVVFQAERGHGFAAEKANHKIDQLFGKTARLIGGDNAKNGADRIVDGAYIQTKYCNGGGKCISDCFDSNGKFRYLTEGKPMQIEVPSDMYESAVQSMQEKIRQGRLPGVSDHHKASEIVRKGNVTYNQAKNIAKFGTVEGLTYDAANGIQLAGGAGSVSAAVTFALSVWRGEGASEALEAACYSGLKVGGIAFITTIATSQLGKTGLELGLRPGADWVTGQLGSKATRWISSNLSSIHGASNLSGAASKNHVSKLLRGNFVTAAVTTVVLSSGDFVRLFQGRISFGQAFKNIGTTGAAVAGGLGGASYGAALGATAGGTIGSAIPILGTAAGIVVGKFLGGILGGLVGGSAAGSATSSVLDGFIEDDAQAMLLIVNEVFGDLAVEYLLSEAEATASIGQFEQLNLVEKLRDVYASKDRQASAAAILSPLIETQVKLRPKVVLPSASEFMSGIRKMVDRTMVAEARERRIRLLQGIGHTLKWCATVAGISLAIWYAQEYWQRLPTPVPLPIESAVPVPLPIPDTVNVPVEPVAEAPPRPTANLPESADIPPSPEGGEAKINTAPSADQVLTSIKGKKYTEALAMLNDGANLKELSDEQNVFTIFIDSNPSLYYSSESPENEDVKLLKKLISSGATGLEKSTSFGGLVWHQILYMTQIDLPKFFIILDLMIENGVNLNQQDSRKKTILSIANWGPTQPGLVMRGGCVTYKDSNFKMCPD